MLVSCGGDGDGVTLVEIEGRIVVVVVVVVVRIIEWLQEGGGGLGGASFGPTGGSEEGGYRKTGTGGRVGDVGVADVTHCGKIA